MKKEPHRLRDDYGAEIAIGDRLSLAVGAPAREVIVTVAKRNGRMIVEHDEGRMSLAQVLRYFPAEIVRGK